MATPSPGGTPSLKRGQRRRNRFFLLLKNSDGGIGGQDANYYFLFKLSFVITYHEFLHQEGSKEGSRRRGAATTASYQSRKTSSSGLFGRNIQNQKQFCLQIYHFGLRNISIQFVLWHFFSLFTLWTHLTLIQKTSILQYIVHQGVQRSSSEQSVAQVG